MRKFVLGREIRGEHLLAGGAGLGDKRREAMIALRPDHDIDGPRARHDLGPLGLRDAAGDGNQRVAALSLSLFLGKPGAAELRIDLLRRLLPDVAGIENDEIGFGLILGQDIACRLERFGHALGVVGVHLAAEGLDMELLGQRSLGGLSQAPFVEHACRPRQGPISM